MTNLIGIKELADHLGVSVKTLRVRVSKGKIAQPVKRFGDELFWDRKAVGVDPLDIYGIPDATYADLISPVRKLAFTQAGDDINERILNQPRPVRPVDCEINIQREGGLRRGELHVVQAKSRKDKSEYLHGTDAQTLQNNPNRPFAFDEDVKHAYLTPIKPLPLDEGKA